VNSCSQKLVVETRGTSAIGSRFPVTAGENLTVDISLCMIMSYKVWLQSVSGQ
jgi:hypothetical protein